MNTTPSNPGLVRALGPLAAIAIVVGTVIGSGVFKKPQVVAENLPSFGLAATVWITGGLLALLGSLALAEVAVLFPRAGGNYVFLREAFGRPAAFLWGWVEFWIIRAASFAALATIFTESLHDILRSGSGGAVLTPWEQRALTVGVILMLALVNVRGVTWGGYLQLAVTTVKVASLLGIMILPFVILALGRSPADRIPTEAVGMFTQTPAAGFPGGLPSASLSQLHAATAPRAFTLAAFLTALLGVLWAYHGWMNIGPVAEEVRNPSRNLPLALIGGTLVVVFLYLGANLAYHLVLAPWEMARMKDTPVATVFSLRLLGPIGALVMSAAVMTSVFGALNGNLLVGPRLLYAMGQDGLAPKALGAVSPRYRTPALAILVMAGWACLLVLAVGLLTEVGVLRPDKSAFDVMTDFAMFGAVTFETLAVATIFVFRWRMPEAERPYRCWGYPWVPALYLVLPVLILGNMFVNQQVEAAVGVGFIALGALVYWGYLRRPVGPGF
ncbi:MAG: amino acid permease [Gemmataceae bacterium]|nr:amino acid permease [Gemmataceae bacterium]